MEAEAAEAVGCPESTEASAQGHDCIAIAVEDPECEDAVFEDTDWEDDSSEPEAEVEPQADRLTNFTKSGVPMSRRSRGSEECVCVCLPNEGEVGEELFLSEWRHARGGQTPRHGRSCSKLVARNRWATRDRRIHT